MQIKDLILFTVNPDVQRRFYTEKLQCPLLHADASFFGVQIGNSRLHFKKSPLATPYHFAFTIPSNKEKEALNWLKNRVDILKSGKDEIVDFPNWNAKSIYFYDEDKNIVEFIARKNLKFGSDKPFGSDSLIEISEIGLPVDNIRSAYKILAANYGLEMFDGNFEKFCAIGDERGLFITINKLNKNWFPTDEEAFPSPFKMKMQIKDAIRTITFEKGRINSNI